MSEEPKKGPRRLTVEVTRSTLVLCVVIAIVSATFASLATALILGGDDSPATTSSSTGFPPRADGSPVFPPPGLDSVPTGPTGP